MRSLPPKSILPSGNRLVTSEFAMEVRRKIRRLLYRFPLGRLLIFDRLFRVAIIALAALIIFLSLFLPRIWRLSPAGFEPVIRVSGLDVVQSWSLSRSARRATAERQFERAHFAWLAAIANHPADPTLVRGSLNCFLLSPDWERRVQTAVQQCFWLLKLTQTNHADLELVSDVLERVEQYELLKSLLENAAQPLPPTLHAARLRTLFQVRDMKGFDEAWRAEEITDPELRLYRSAYLAGWTRSADFLHRVREIEAALDGEHGEVGARLLIAVAEQRKDLDRCRSALEHLKTRGADRLSDWAPYWRLVRLVEGTERALELVAEGESKVRSADGAKLLGQLHREFSGPAGALSFLKRTAETFGGSPQFLTFYAGELLMTGDWPELRRVVYQIRNASTQNASLKAFSYFLESEWNRANGRDGAARTALQNMLNWRFEVFDLGMAVAAHLIKTGREESARDLLLNLEPPAEQEFPYWSLVFKTAALLQDAELMGRAARKTYELRPTDPVAANHLLAVLLLERRDASEALRLSFALMLEHPDSLVTKINHAAALLLNGRAAEAETILRSVPVDPLSPAERTMFYRNRFEAALQLGRPSDAESHLARVDRDYLYPEQREWLDKTLREAKKTHGSSSSVMSLYHASLGGPE